MEAEMRNEFEKVYIGDGVYAQWDGMTVLLETERDTGKHYIYLDPAHIQNLVRLVWTDRDMLNHAEPRIAKRKRGQG
jgi:hypothetical protein